jgi:diguanylate cyclase (GGDEF)-like protein/PAS domain S-box-containing protein
MAIALALHLALWPVETGLQYVTFFPAVAVTAVFAGFWPGMFTTAMGVVLATYFFTYPYYSFSIESLSNSFWSNIVFIAGGLVVCYSIETMHRFRLNYARELDQSHHAQIESEQKSQKLKGIIDNVLDGIISISDTGVIESFNKAATQIFGYEESEVIGKNVSILMPEPDRSKHDEYIRRYLNTGERKIIGIGRDVVGVRKDGSTFPMELAVSEVTGKAHMFTGVVRDISERKAYEDYMHHLAHHDQLTGLPNRALFVDRLHQLLAKARRDDSRVAVMFIDLDNFKPINDNLGHDVGDLLLKEVTARLLDCLRESDTAARIGGDEFITLLPIETVRDALLAAEKIRHAIDQPYALASRILSISSSIGVSLYPDHGSEERELLKNADIAMYHAKKNGRNNVMIYQPDMEEAGSSRGI